MRRIREERTSSIVVASSSSSSSNNTDCNRPRLRQSHQPARAAMCPPLVVAPAHGTLQLVPLRHSSAPPISSHDPRQQVSSASSSSSREMLPPSSNASVISDGMLRRPVQITADPRVYRGSVFANRRLANDRARAAEQVEYKEKRYRVGVIRDQLNTLLPRVPPISTSHRVQKGPVSVTQKTRSSTYLPEISTGNGAALSSSIDKTRGTKSFATARFAPIRGSKMGNGDIFGNPLSTLKEPSTSEFPVKVVVNFDTLHQQQPSSSYRRHSRHVALSQTATPPTSSRPVYQIVDTAVQTSDNFEMKIEGLVQELANSAIEMAMINLDAENTLSEVRKKAEAAERELRAVTRKQNLESADWRRQLHEKNMQLETWKKQEEEAREAQELAQATCDEVTRNTLENLRIREKNSKKSIGLDTRDMVMLEHRMALVTAELEKDFFPWIFQRAERMFKNRMARSQLDHSMLNEAYYRREQAKKRLINFDSHAL